MDSEFANPAGGEKAKIALPVRVFGMDGSGKPFSQNATLLEASESGARVSGLQVFLNRGDVIGVQCGERRGRFRVVHIGRVDSVQKGQAELEPVQVPDNFWGLEREGRDRRKFMRHAVAGVALVRTSGSSGAFQTALTDVSFGGCYLQTLVPLTVRTAVTIQLKIGGYSFGVAGVVRACHPNMGMGIEFTGESNQSLKDFVEQLESGEKPSPESSLVTKANAIYAANRVRSVSSELKDVTQLMQCTEVEPHILRQFRDVVGFARNTAWSLERYMESQLGSATAAAQLEFLTAERIRLATAVCKALAADVAAVPVDEQQLRELAEVVEEIITAAARARLKRHS